MARSSSRRKVPGTPKPRSYRAPTCSSCGGRTIRSDSGQWFCPDCADAWLKAHINKNKKSVGGVELPAGVMDERKQAPSFRDIAPNRAQRRRIGRFHRGR